MKDRLGGIDAIIFNIITPNTWLFGSERTVTDTTMRLLLATSCQNILMVETQKCERLESQNIPLPTSINPCIQLYICTATFSHLGLSHGCCKYQCIFLLNILGLLDSVDINVFIYRLSPFPVIVTNRTFPCLARDSYINLNLHLPLVLGRVTSQYISIIVNTHKHTYIHSYVLSSSHPNPWSRHIASMPCLIKASTSQDSKSAKCFSR